MNIIAIQHKTIAQTIWPSNNIIRNITLAVLASIALIISAKIQIPFYPVPMTMQTFVVLLVGMALGWRLGLASILLYLAEGAIGLPVFAGTPEKGIGLAYMMGPTGGYLIGFAVGAVIVGWLAEKGWDRNFITTILAMTIGNICIFCFGLLWLGSLIGWDKPVLEFGLYPFLLAAALKIILATILLPLIWKFIKKSEKQE